VRDLCVRVHDDEYHRCRAGRRLYITYGHDRSEYGESS
jgi:hypothetical protein